MAQVSFLPDKVAPDLDAKLEAVAAVCALSSRPIRIRLQPDFYNPDSRSYDGWTGVVWSVDLEDVAEGKLLREALTKFMAGFGDPGKQGKLLKMLEQL